MPPANPPETAPGGSAGAATIVALIAAAMVSSINLGAANIALVQIAKALDVSTSCERPSAAPCP